MLRDTNNQVHARTGNSSRILKLVVAVLVIAAVAWFLGRAIAGQWEEVRGHTWDLNAVWLLLSAVLGWLDIISLILLWRFLLHRLSHRHLRFADAFRITVLANLGKYIPGKIWTILGVVVMLRNKGFAAPTVLSATVLHQAFTVISGLLLSGLVLGERVMQGFTVVPIIIIAFVSLLVLYPPILGRLLNLGLRLLKREPVEVRLSFSSALLLLLIYIIVWVGYGLSFWLLLKGVGIERLPVLETGAAFIAAYLLGFLLLFAPGGLGVREGVLTLLLSPHLGTGLAATAAVVARLWMTVVELIGVIPAAFIRDENRRRGSD